jgi:hypothetical protein
LEDLPPRNPIKNNPKEAEQAAYTAEVLRLLPLVKQNLLNHIDSGSPKAHELVRILRTLAGE